MTIGRTHSWNEIIKLHLLCCALFILFLSCGRKQERCIPFGGRINYLLGCAEIFKTETGLWDTLKISSEVEFGDSIRTAEESQVEIGFGEGNTIRLAEKSKIRISDIVDTSSARTIEVFNFCGTVLSNIKKLTTTRNQYTVRTPTAVAAIRGTFFSVSFVLHTRTSHVNVMAGKVWVRNPHVRKHKHVVVIPGHFAIVAFGKVPGLPQKINYGQWKKVERLMAPAVFRKYQKQLKIKKMPGPKGIGKKISKKWGRKSARIGKPGRSKIKVRAKAKGVKASIKAKSKKSETKGKGSGKKKLQKSKGASKEKPQKAKAGKWGKGSSKKGKKGKGGGKKK